MAEFPHRVIAAAAEVLASRPDYIPTMSHHVYLSAPEELREACKRHNVRVDHVALTVTRMWKLRIVPDGLWEVE